MMDGVDDGKAFSPPYNVSWSTFLSTVERAASDLPNRLDRSYLSSQAGSVQTYLIAAFKSFGLIDDELRPTGLRQFAAEPQDRPAIMAGLLRQHYAPVVALGQTKSTPGELESCFNETFPGITGESRRKAIRFFLSAAGYANLSVSALWKVPKASSSSRRSSVKRKTSGSPSDPPPPVSPAGDNTGYSTRVDIAAGTVVLTVDVNPIQLLGEDRAFVFGLIDRMNEHASRTPPTDPGPQPNEEHRGKADEGD